jgi:hypothetical protein
VEVRSLEIGVDRYDPQAGVRERRRDVGDDESLADSALSTANRDEARLVFAGSRLAFHAICAYFTEPTVRSPESMTLRNGRHSL